VKNKKDETCAKEPAAITYECMEQNICEMNDRPRVTEEVHEPNCSVLSNKERDESMKSI
jgi:hypothetical protein